MCSILLTNKTIMDLHDMNYYLKFRGPDLTNVMHMRGLTFVHNLLSISGAITPQPLVDQDVVAMHNGEIYNYGDHPSDGFALIPSYKKYGETFCKHLDGEFAVILVDFLKQMVIISTDPFRSKPLWIAQQELEFGVCTYRTPLEKLGFTHVQKVPPNSILTLDLKTNCINKIAQVYDWDLHQHKKDFTDWQQAFANSIRKRTHNLREKIFIGLSSGYDSGAIACELIAQNVPFTPFTVLGKELPHILQARARPDHVWIQPHAQVWQQAHDLIKQRTESFKYTICSSSSDYNEFGLDLQDDSGANGLSMVCAQAASRGIKIYLSGQGADEIFSDYGFQGNKIYPHSNFGGLWPQNLQDIFPWNSFYGSSQESYLAKEEYVAGAYGIEARYPYLDTQVVQEFLWLTPELKNSTYKSVLHDYLTKNSYPFQPNQKIGF